MKLKWNLPGPDTPGYLRRRRDLLALLDANLSPKNVEDLNQYLLQFIDKPKDRAEAMEKLLDLSGRDFSLIVIKLLGSAGAKVEPPLEESLETP